MLATRQRIVLNYYLFLGAALVAQAFFTVLTGNQQIGQTQELSALDRDRQQLEKEVQALENDIALNQSMFKQKELIASDQFVEITNREIIHDRAITAKTVASALP